MKPGNAAKAPYVMAHQLALDQTPGSERHGWGEVEEEGGEGGNEKSETKKGKIHVNFVAF